MSKRPTERLLARYTDTGGNPFRISEINTSANGNNSELVVCATGIRDVLMSSWLQKFSPEHLSVANVERKIPTVDEQIQRITHPRRQARYLIASMGDAPVSNPSDIHAVMRVERYKQRRIPFSTYPNITDLETRDGLLAEGNPYHRQAAALLLHGITEYKDTDKVSAYTERPNSDGLAFYAAYGLAEDENMSAEDLTEAIGDGEITYVHMAGTTVAAMRNKLSELDDFLA